MSIPSVQTVGLSRESLPCLGLEGYAAYGGPLVVLNTDTMKLTANPLDPYEALNDTNDVSSSYDNIRRLATGGYGQFLDIYHTSDAESETTSPTIIVFGKTPTKEPSHDRRWPEDVAAGGGWDSTATGLDLHGFWIPLGGWDALGAINNTGIFDLTDVLAMDADAIPPSMLLRLNMPVRVNLVGCSQVMVMILTIATGAITRGMVIGRLIG